MEQDQQSALAESARTTFHAHAATYVVINLLPAVLGVASVFIFIRVFGHAVYGQYAVALGISLTAATYAAGWLVQSILRFQAQWERDGSGARFAATVGTSLLAASAVAIIAAYIIALTSLEISFAGAALTLAVIPLAAAYQVTFATVQARLEPRRVLIAESVKAAALVGLPLILLLWLPHTPAILLLGVVFGYGAGLLVLFRWRLRPGNTDREALTVLWNFGWPLGLWLGFSQLLAVVDRYLIAHMLDFAAAGSYASVFDLTRKGFLLALSPVTLAVHPMLTRLWTEERRAEAMNLLRYALRWQIALSAVGVIGLIAIEPYLMASLLGKGAAAGAGLLLPLAMGSAIWSISLLLHKTLELRNRTRLMLWSLMGASALNIAFDIVAIPRVGITGAAWGTVVGSTAYMIFVILAARAARGASLP